LDTVTYRSHDLAVIWKDAIRKAQQLKQFNELDDEKLIEMNSGLHLVLARVLDRGLDRSEVGSYFVRLGKDRMRLGFPLSEILYAVNTSQTTLIDFLLSELDLGSSLVLYQVIESIKRITEFYILGSFYITKGFLEETYVHLNIKESVSEELLKRYFRDDFFFKK